MNYILRDFIKELSEKDKKNLSQKVLKLFEEGGELAKVSLPYDNAFATRHRFTDRAALIEEVADVILTAMSVGYHIGMTHEELDSKLQLKASYWATLQDNEVNLKDKIPFEIHVTVEHVDSLKVFCNICNTLDVKPIVLDLYLKSNLDTFKDVMTSSTFFGDNRGVVSMMESIVSDLESYGYKVTRSKIETVPWHPRAPQKKTDRMPEGCYFESHLGVVLFNDAQVIELNDFLDHANKVIEKAPKARLSKNAFKSFDDGSCVYMVTLRDNNTTRDEFTSSVKQYKDALSKKFTVEKEIIEFSIYDSNVMHDAKWMCG